MCYVHCILLHRYGVWPSKSERSVGVLPLWGTGGGIKNPCGCRFRQFATGGDADGDPVGRSPRGYGKDTTFPLMNEKPRFPLGKGDGRGFNVGFLMVKNYPSLDKLAQLCAPPLSLK